MTKGDLVSSPAASAQGRPRGEQARVDFALYGTIDPDEGAARIAEMVEAGVAAFKFSTFGTDPKRFPAHPAPCWPNVSRRSRPPDSRPACITRTTNMSAPAWRR